ncbi:uncharacterized protein H6S33_012310 [Morchella sextelata]|uniref:uncharacterized protein n=1 Tax=Morchella sextelata TaxID=1174677 RepID=UPI001D04DD86|nr:uncharacterized protein H6S33_012310 [Morchella sextelata]KAH0609764.1 hypothetical protein H6S33_012310 [Morchella sextelata]
MKLKDFFLLGARVPTACWCNSPVMIPGESLSGLEMNCFDGVENGRLKDERQLRRVGTDTYEYLSVPVYIMPVTNIMMVMLCCCCCYCLLRLMGSAGSIGALVK